MVNPMNITENLTDVLSAIPGLSMLVTIAQAIGVVLLIYLIFMLIRGILQYRYVRKLSQISENVEAINKKLDDFLKKAKK